MAGLHYVCETNSTLFCNGCDAAVMDDEKHCPGCNKVVYPEEPRLRHSIAMGADMGREKYAAHIKRVNRICREDKARWAALDKAKEAADAR